MSAAPEGMTTLAQDILVSPGSVESALSQLWRSAQGESDEGRVTRACLWNLVVYNPKPKKAFRNASGHGYGLRNLLDGVTPSIPARIIRLEFAGKGELPKGAETAAWVAAKCVPRGGGEQQICSEEVNLLVGGKDGASHFPSLVRALLQPSLPIGLLWLDDLPHRGWLLDQLVRLCDRLIFDSYSGDMESDLRTVKELMAETNGLFVDIGWMRLTPVRHLLAGFFDTPSRAEHLRNIESVTVETTSAGRNAGLLLLGWLLSQCDYRRFEAAPKKKGVFHHWKVRAGKKSFPVEFKLSSGEGGRDGLIRIEILAGGSRYAIRQVDAGHVVLDPPVGPDAKRVLHGWSDSELVVAGLGAHGIDPLYPQVLETATALLAKV
ncbi:MAG: glucose-6-phosphate dehydrogenase assembly protein OpcA [SAR324 cluster bacterium]|nr:glucose-6-phosphate dehydrogenase assembly protein OpcA [SAR324 cluster bacterium]